MKSGKSISRAIGIMCLLTTACGGNGKSDPPTVSLPKAIGKTEGALNLVTWEGYAEDAWVKPFESATGCVVNRKYAGSSDEMVALFRQGGGQYDLVSASGDASLRLVASKAVQPINTALIPDFADFLPMLKTPAHNTVGGVTYGISYLWGSNLLMWDTRAISTPPTSWSVIYDPAHAGRITVPDNPIQIADAALYLMRSKPDLGITDPYSLTQPQLDAAVALLKRQRPLVRKYWALASDEISLFSSRDAAVGPAWPYQVLTLRKAGMPVESAIPAEGATGWADSFMLASGAPHPNCAYKYLQWVSTPDVQAQQALFFGGTPVNVKACAPMNAREPGSCAQYNLEKPEQYASRLHFWKTPQKTCADGSQNCTDYTAWQRAWQVVKQ